MLRHETLTEDELIARYIEPNPDKIGRAYFRLVESGTPMWRFVAELELAHGETARIAEDYGLSPEQIAAALAFYRRYKVIIDDHLFLASQPHPDRA